MERARGGKGYSKAPKAPDGSGLLIRVAFVGTGSFASILTYAHLTRKKKHPEISPHTVPSDSPTPETHTPSQGSLTLKTSTSGACYGCGRAMDSIPSAALSASL